MKFRPVFRSVMAGLAALGVLASFQACKPIRSEQVKPTGKEQESLNSQVALGLKMDFYDAEEGGTVPNFDRPAASHYMVGVMRDGQVIQLKKRISLSPEKLFLAIADSFGDQRITNAFYEYHSISPSNSIQGNRPPDRLNYDQTQHRFYLAMDQLTEQNGEKLSSLDLQVLDLSLTFNDGSDSHLELRFYVTAHLPSLEQVRVSQLFHEPKASRLSSMPRLSAQSIATQEGFEVLTEHYRNPIQQPLSLWFSAKDVSFRLLTQLGMRIEEPNNVALAPDEAGFEIGPRQFSSVPLDRVRLIVKDLVKGESRAFLLQGDSSIPVLIDPGQELEIHWFVLASEKIPVCKEGEPASWVYRACGYPDLNIQVKFKAPENPDCPKLYGMFADATGPVSMKGIWAVQSYQVVGQFKNSVALSEPIGTQGAVLDAALREGLAVQARVSNSKSTGDESVPPALTPLASCQGIF